MRHPYRTAAPPADISRRKRYPVLLPQRSDMTMDRIAKWCVVGVTSILLGHVIMVAFAICG